MLLLNPQRDLTREHLECFMSTEEDSSKYLEHVRGEHALGIATAFHVRMRDSAGIQIPIEMFCVRFSQGTDVHHFVGLREFNDATGSIKEQAPHQVFNQHVHGQSTEEFAVTTAVDVEKSSNRSVSDRSSVSSIESELLRNGASVTINVLSKACDVVMCSPHFSRLCDSEPKDLSLLSWIRGCRDVKLLGHIKK